MVLLSNGGIRPWRQTVYQAAIADLQEIAAPLVIRAYVKWFLFTSDECRRRRKQRG